MTLNLVHSLWNKCFRAERLIWGPLKGFMSDKDLVNEDSGMFLTFFKFTPQESSKPPNDHLGVFFLYSKLVIEI